MAGSSAVLSDSSLLSRLDRAFFVAESWLALISGITIFLLVLLAVVNVLGRWFFSLPVSGYIDWVEQFMAIFAFFGIAYCQRLGGHIRMDILVSKLHGRSLWFSELVTTVLMLFVTVVLIYGSYLHFLRAYTNGDSSIDIGLPVWPAKLVVPFALTVLALRLILQLWGYIRALKEGGDTPVAVPLIEDAATQASHEAESVSGMEQEDNGGRS
ncbi:TRAP transporter small permease subunit [Aliamphritea spongicola]|uniref:TRAP transporter small permease subunit n=1 Tax=Aliamphritea spongicola TaxID=707589 RepID=UPI00196B2C8E|nr:TRAP transporter small permease [Aliamphritea spongicola]MBN3561110.1 TRAP transporter small permease [Aliamphritea spongicola]